MQRRMRFAVLHGVAAHRTAVAGFGLLEVLVSLALLALTGGTLFQWINQSMSTVSRLERIQAEARLNLDAQGMMNDVNPAMQPEGEREAGAIRVAWTAKPLTPMSDGSPGTEGQIGLWRTGLFRSSVKAKNAQSGVEIHFELVQVGLTRREGAQDLTEGMNAER
jgi:type II secretory pathway component PulJ